MSKPIIQVENLSKQYYIGALEKRHDTLRDSLVAAAKAPFNKFIRDGSTEDDTIWALKDIGFDVQPGEIIGIIGRNGAGKSTLLKVLSRITEPTAGSIKLYGRVASLLEVGTGFHPELTGRENIFLNGAILSMPRRHIEQKFDEIVSFAEVGKFIDTPVKRYSSGMYLKLAFAVAAHLDPEILVIDEVLAVGDATFQKKCLGKMGEVAKQGRTVLFVSHNMTAVEALCTRCILLSGGQVRKNGLTSQVIREYLGGHISSDVEIDLSQHRGRVAGSTPIAQALRFIDEVGHASASIFIGADLCIQILLKPILNLTSPDIGIGIDNAMGQRVFTVHTRFANSGLSEIKERSWVECKIPEVALMPGQYSIKLAIGASGRDIDVIEQAAMFEVLPRDLFGTGAIPNSSQGFVIQHSTWHANVSIT